MPDLKKNEVDVILWYKKIATWTSMEAQHQASILVLHHLMGNQRFLVSMSLTSYSKFLGLTNVPK
jgi:hypothetical protein